MSTQGTAIELASKQKAIKEAMSKKADLIKKLVPRHVDPSSLMRIVWTAISQTPKLAQCTPISLVRATIQAAMLGLIPNDGRGLAWLIPYKTEAQFQIGYKGLIALAFQSSEVQTIHAREVYAGDEFNCDNVLEEIPIHRPMNAPAIGPNGKVLREVTHAYCLAKIRGQRDMEVMFRWELDAIRARSASRDNGPWVTDFGMMCRKTAIKRAARYWPVATERMSPLSRSLQLDDQADMGLTQTFEDPEVEEEFRLVDRGSARTPGDLVKRDVDPVTGEVAPAAGDGK